MTREEFNSQAERLKATWPTSFPDEKIKLIWTATYQLEISWFRKLVTDMIANNRQAPLPAEFITAANQRHKREYFDGIPTNAEKIHPSKNSIFSKEDIAEIFGMIKKRMTGEISFKELEEYGKMIELAVKNKKDCALCVEGVVFSEPTQYASPTVSKCTCRLGSGRQENWPTYRGSYT
jgi:hypothetical protein